MLFIYAAMKRRDSRPKQNHSQNQLQCMESQKSCRLCDSCACCSASMLCISVSSLSLISLPFLPCLCLRSVLGGVESRGVLRKISDMLEVILKRMDSLSKLDNTSTTDARRLDELSSAINRYTTKFYSFILLATTTNILITSVRLIYCAGFTFFCKYIF